MTLADLRIGQQAAITEVAESPTLHKLLDMGCLPGELVRLKFKAPFGDPLCVEIGGYDLMIRISEARTINVNVER